MTRRWYHSGRFWVSMVTAAVVAVIVASAWPTILTALASLSRVDPWILALLLPTQLASFAVTGEVLFSFLRARGELSGVRPLTAMRMSLEFNFANHMLPSGGAAGITYTSWKLASLGVAPAKGTLAQLARFAVTFVSFSLLMLLTTVWLALGDRPNPLALVAAVGIGIIAVAATVLGVVLMRRRRRMHRIAGKIAGLVNVCGRFIRRPNLISPITLIRFFDGLHLELRAIIATPSTLRGPFAWSFLVHVFDAGLLWVALASFHIEVDLALVFVTYGLATLVSMVVTTPNGVGAYELVVIGMLATGGAPTALLVAAITLARAIQLVATIVFGWAFYQHSVASAGRVPKASR